MLSHASTSYEQSHSSRPLGRSKGCKRTAAFRSHIHDIEVRPKASLRFSYGYTYLPTNDSKLGAHYEQMRRFHVDSHVMISLVSLARLRFPVNSPEFRG